MTLRGRLMVLVRRRCAGWGDMPNRILREGLLDSDRIGQVSIGAEVLFCRLMLLADDFGRYDGRVSVICRRAFVNRRSVDEHMTGEWLQELADAELLHLYHVDGRPFIELLNFRQRTRAQVSKYPSREDADQKNQSLSVSFDGHSADKRLPDGGPTRTYSDSDSETEYPLTPTGGAGVAVDVTGGRTQAVDDAEAVGDGRRGAVEIRTWLEGCHGRGEKPIPPDCAALLYARQAGIPDEFVALHWREFKVRNAESRKRQRDWRRTFLNSLRGNWYGLWLLNADGSCNLSTKGVQAKRVHEALQAEGAAR